MSPLPPTVVSERPAPASTPHFWTRDGQAWRYSRDGVRGSIWSGGSASAIGSGPVLDSATSGGSDVMTLAQWERWHEDAHRMVRFLRMVQGV